MAGEGNRGSSSGMRFNPREGPEFMEEDRNLGLDDAESRQKLDEKKRQEKEDRHKKLAGLQHLSVKVVGKKKPLGDDQRNDEKLSEMTGPSSSTGYPLDVATGAKTGGGSAMGGNPVNIMTGNLAEVEIDAILKKKKSTTKKKGRKSDDIKAIKTRQRAKETRRRRAKMGETALSRTYKNPMARGFRDTEGYTKTRGTIAQRVKGSGGKNVLRRGHGGRGKGWRHSTTSKGTKREATPDPRKVQANVETSQMARQVPTHTSGYQLPSAQAYENVMKPSPKGAPIDHPESTASYFTPQKSRQVSRPGVARTVGGHEIASPGGPTDGMTGFQTASVLTSLERLLEYEGIISKANISGADITEFRFLIRELKRLLRSGALKKSGLEDAEHDDERPTPNSHRKTTSHPTGATEVDPDDDPRYWGAHPLGLLLPRRGHM